MSTLFFIFFQKISKKHFITTKQQTCLSHTACKNKPHLLLQTVFMLMEYSRNMHSAILAKTAYASNRSTSLTHSAASFEYPSAPISSEKLSVIAAPQITIFAVQPFSFARSTTSFIRIIVVVISAERPITFAPSFIAVSTITSAGTSLPRSIT